MEGDQCRCSLPDVGLHVRYFLGGVLGCAVMLLIGTKFPNVPQALLIVVSIPFWIAMVVPLVGYLVVYPFLHLKGRYDGGSAGVWMFWLVIDTVGLTFGMVRFWYYFSEIIPDFRGRRAEGMT